MTVTLNNAAVGIPSSASDAWVFGRPRVTVVYGDSFAGLSHRTVSPSSIVVAGGVATATLTSHGLYTGSLISVVSAADAAVNVHQVPVTVSSTSVFSFAVPGAANGTVAGAGGRSITVLDLSSQTDKGFPCHANRLSGGAFRFVSNAGASGHTSTEIRQYWASRVAAFNPDLVVRICGYNDINAGLSIDEMAANLLADITSARNIGAKMLVSGIWPWSSGAAADSTANRIKAEAFNRMADTLCATYPHVKFVDPRKFAADPATGLAKSGYIDVDFIHATWLSMREFALVAILALGDWIAPRRQIQSGVDSVAFDSTSRQIARSGPWASTTGGILSAPVTAAVPGDITSSTAVAGVAAGMRARVTGSTTGVAWVDVSPDGLGYMQYGRYTAVAVNDVGTVSYAATIADVQPGDIVDISLYGSMTTAHNASNKSPSGQGITALWMDLVVVSAAGGYTIYEGRKSGSAPPTTDSIGELFVFDGVVIPAGAALTSVTLELNVQFGAIGGSAQIGVGHLEMRKR